MSYEEIASYESVFNDIKRVLEQGRRRAIAHVNHEMLVTYWNVGRIIVEHEQENPDRAEYGAATLKRLSRELTETYGKGFSRSNLQNMRLLYLDYPICQTLSGKLSWSHYCELLSISDPDKRRFYERECIEAGWSVRELKRQISTSLYERLIQSGSTWSMQRRLSPSNDEARVVQPADIIKDPYPSRRASLNEHSSPILKNSSLNWVRALCSWARSSGSRSTTLTTMSTWSSTTSCSEHTCSSS